jgi:hypothetical protein
MGYTKFTKLQATEDLKAPKLPKLVKLGDIAYNSAASGTPVALYTLPEGAILKKAICVVGTAFNAGTTNVLILGTAADDDALLLSGTVDEATTGAYFRDAWLVGGTGGTVIQATYTQTGTAATTGAAALYAEIVESMS